jgi:alkylation response protein AidB-like acyl-CoA dehydrogenase
MMQAIFSEEMAWARAPGNDRFGTRMIGPTLIAFGTDRQKEQFLPGIAQGETQWCQGYSEPNAGSDLASLQMRAVDDGDAHEDERQCEPGIAEMQYGDDRLAQRLQ